jgi:hypothetical protein
MTRLIIEFDWVHDPKGYHLDQKGRVVRNGKGRRPEDQEACRPLSSTDTLFRIFARMATTPEGVLEFVQRYGPLTWGGWDASHGEQVALVMMHARHMNQILESRAGKSKRSGFPEDRPQTGVPSSIDAWVLWDRTAKEFKWSLRPKTLLDALWLQLGQWLTSGAQIRACQKCGDWFEAGRGTGRRADAKFCSEEHKIAFHSLERSRER